MAISRAGALAGADVVVDVSNSPSWADAAVLEFFDTSTRNLLAAEAAAVALTGGGHEGKTYELAGDEAYTLPELAAEISRRAGKAIPYKDLPEADYAAALKGSGLPDDLARAIASWDVGAAKGALFDDGHQLSKLIGRPTTPLAVTVADALTRVP